MAIAGRQTLEALTDAIRLHLGEKLTGYSRLDDDQTATQKWSIYRQINSYLQGIRQHIHSRLRTEGVSLRHGELFLDAYRTSGILTVTAGSSTAYMPVDTDGVITLWDSTNSRKLDFVENPSKYFATRSRRAVPGPPEWIVSEGWALNGSDWQRKVTIYPSTVTGVTPSIAIEYYRIPATMPESDATAEYPDIDPQFQDVLIYGVVTSMMGSVHPAYQEYRTKETELLLAMARHSKVVC
jgi:hypothetical protein